MVVTQSRIPFHETVVALGQAIKDGGATVFAMIDQTGAAKAAGLSLRPTWLIVFGNPKGGTPLMDAYPLAALDLPLKLLIWEDGTTVNVAYTPASEIAQRHNIPLDEPHIIAMDHALEKLVALVAVTP